MTEAADVLPWMRDAAEKIVKTLDQEDIFDCPAQWSRTEESFQAYKAGFLRARKPIDKEKFAALIAESAPTAPSGEDVASAVLNGWRIVPYEPTDAMVAALSALKLRRIKEAVEHGTPGPGMVAGLRDEYFAWLGAAPWPPLPAGIATHPARPQPTGGDFASGVEAAARVIDTYVARCERWQAGCQTDEGRDSF